MNGIEILSLPQLVFSHIYKADAYSNRFSARKNFLEISYIASGSLRIECGERSFLVGQGDVVCFLRDQPTAVFAEAFHCHHTVGIAVDWRFSKEESALLLPTVLSAQSNTSEICGLIDGFIHKQVTYKTEPIRGAAKILDLLCAIDRCSRKAQSGRLSGELLYARRAKRYIQQNIYASISQNAVAEHLGISPEYLCSVFKKAEGTTVMRYINKMKLENIKGLMDHADLRLYEAAALYGYSDPNYVSRLYKRIFGYNITDKPSVYSEE